MLLSRLLDTPLLLADTPDYACAGVSTVPLQRPGRRLGRRGELAERSGRHVESSGAGDAAEVGALLSVRAFLSLGELTPDDVHVQVLHGKIDCNDVLTGVTVQDLELAERCVSSVAALPVWVVSSFDGDLVPTDRLDEASGVLQAAGHQVRR
jgi:hypothetical protein